MIAKRIASALLAAFTCRAAMAQSELPKTGLRVLSAGGLRAALTDVVRVFEPQRQGSSVTLVFGASGLLKDRPLGGERADIFASANMEHLAALAGPGFEGTSDTLVGRLLDARVRVGTSTPKADPAGDYTWQMFERIEAQGLPGAFMALSDKALQLTDGPNSPPPPTNRNVYGALMAPGQADVFITYCTNAVVTQAEEPALRRIEVRAAVSVSASYRVTVIKGASADADPFVAFLLGSAGQALLARRGFSAP